MKKHWKKIVIGLILLLIFTNPSANDFNDYLKGIGEDKDGYRSGYFLIFSTFNHTHIEHMDIGITDIWGKKKTIDFPHQYIYLGIFKNYFLISKK